MEAERIFKRKIYDRLLQWKETSNGKSALLVQGARRIGKSTIVEEFARREYASYILIDFTKRGTNEIDVEGLAEGVYLLRIMDADGKVYTNKITVR